MPTTAGRPRIEVRFAEAAFAEDLRHSSTAGRRAGERVRHEIGRDGLAPERLLRCQPEGRDGTRLDGCVKSRVPWPDGRWGLVLIPIAAGTRSLTLRVLAFGERHPTAPWSPSVYQVAHRRLHAG